MPSLLVISAITLNLSRPNSGVVVHAKQFDKSSRVIDISLINNNAPWDPPVDSEIVVMFAKPDGTKGIYDVVENYPVYSSTETYSVGDKVRKEDNIYSCNTAISTPEAWNSSHWTLVGPVTKAVQKLSGTGRYRLTLAEQALACAGNVWVEISFYSGSMRATTLSFLLAVESGVPDNDTLISSNYFNVLTELIEGLLGATTHPPQIDPITRNWLTWNSVQNAYTDSGYSSVGTTGDTGPRGHSIAAISHTSGTHGAGTNDTYSVILDNGSSVGTFQVYNGQDGIGTPDPGNTNPLPDGTASYGSSNAYSRKDHVHPANVDNTDPEDIGTEAYSGESNVYARRDHVHAIGQEIIDMIYPIGSIYMSTNPTSPSTLFGGHWVKRPDRFLVGAGDVYPVYDKQGSPDHTLRVEELPPHKHKLHYYYGSGTAGTGWALTRNGTSVTYNSSDLFVDSTGDGESFSILPPYLAVYMGERINRILYNHNMALVEGNFYDDNGDIFRCTESTSGVVTDDLGDLVGTYVESEEYW